MAEISDTLETDAAAPKKIKTPVAEVEEHSLPDKIAADRYNRQIAAVAAASANGSGAMAGIRISRAVPPGAGA